MARAKHYSPAISRFLVSVLYYEAKAKRIRMTTLTDQLLREALMNSNAWKTAESLSMADTGPKLTKVA